MGSADEALMPNITLFELAESSLADACGEILPAAPDSAPAEEPSFCRASVIGFAGNEVRGSLGVATSQQGLARVLAHFGAAHHEEAPDPDDALGELSNLLLGHIKRKWLQRDLHITLATPVVIRGLSMEVSGKGQDTWHGFESGVGGDRIAVWIDLHCDVDQEVTAVDNSVEILDAGDPMLF